MCVVVCVYMYVCGCVCVHVCVWYVLLQTMWFTEQLLEYSALMGEVFLKQGRCSVHGVVSSSHSYASDLCTHLPGSYNVLLDNDEKQKSAGHYLSERS